ncbi:exported hypothetical protein [Acidobacteriia bacterium SbA2]|nr:exported hypothetical protein [Acidobacteriia bacterium SbA2]
MGGVSWVVSLGCASSPRSAQPRRGVCDSLEWEKYSKTTWEQPLCHVFEAAFHRFATARINRLLSQEGLKG